jgi:hypothetical protein
MQAKPMLLTFLLLALAAAEAHAAMPTPVLRFLGAQKYTAAGATWVRYELSVVNRNDFDQRLFEATASTPACYASLTAAMVRVYDLANPSRPLHTFCPRSRGELGSFWFSLRKGDYGTGRIWIEILDRRTNQKVASNSLRIYDLPLPPTHTPKTPRPVSPN